MAGLALAIAKGGTSQTTAAGARVALGLEIGVDIPSYADLGAAVTDDLQAIEAVTGTGGLTRIGTDTWALRTITGTASRIVVTNGDGVAGAPNIDLSTGYVGQASISTLGTISSGVWNGTDIAIADGGTGVSTLPSAILVGNGTSAILGRTLTGTAAEITVTNGTGVSGNPTLSLPSALTFTGKTVTGGTFTSPAGISGTTITTSTVTEPTLTLKQGTSPTPTAEGDIQWDTDDNAIVVGDGAASKVFRSNRWETISETTIASGATTVNFTDLSPYRRLRAQGTINVTTTGGQPLLRVSTNNGSTYEAGATAYWWRYHAVTTAGGATARVDTSYFGMLAILAIHQTYAYAFTLELEDFNQTKYGYIQCHAGWLATDGNPASCHNSGAWGTTTARNAFQLLASGSTYSGGQIHLEGIRG